MRYCQKCGTQVQLTALRCPNCGASVAAAAAPKKTSPVLVIVLIGCVAVPIVTAIVGIIAAILIPNFLDALQKAKQKTAVRDLERMGAVVEQYRSAHGFAPAAADVDGLATVLGAGGTGVIRPVDPWKHPYVYLCWQESLDARGCDHYRLASTGRDGRLDQPLRTAPAAEFPRSEYDHDIIYGDGALLAMPAAR